MNTISTSKVRTWLRVHRVFKRVGLLVIIALLMPVARDVTEFRDSQVREGAYWYSTNWIVAPYTNIVVALNHPTEHWTNNAIGTERWLVREAKVGVATYWTAVERRPISDL